jgi:hypothetical protein
MGFAFKKSRDAVKKLASNGTPAGAAVIKGYHKSGGGVGVIKAAAGAARKVRKGVKERTLLDVNN